MYGLSSHQGERGTLGPHPAGELDEGNREAVEKKAAVLNLLLDIEEAVPHGDGVEDVAGSGPTTPWADRTNMMTVVLARA